MSIAIAALQPWDIDEAHDNFHPYPKDEPEWTETMWFAFMVPERGLLGYVYPAFRPNLGIQFGGVKINEGESELPWEMPIHHWNHYGQMQPGVDLRRLDLASGLKVTCETPGRRFHITYDTDEVTLDLTFDALMQPMLSSGETGAFVKNGHLDQPCRVTGELVLRGERIEVDCLAMRDRGWGPRKEGRQVQMGYVYAVASANSAFLSVSGTGRSGEDKVLSGFLMRDGVWSRLASGRREVTRDGRGQVAQVVIRATDALGRDFEARGGVKSRFASVHTSMMTWCNLVHWTFDGQECWGEDQDCWGPRLWRDFVRDLKQPAA